MIIIREENNEYRLYNVSRHYVNLTPFTNPNGGSVVVTYYKSFRMRKLYGMKIDVEVDLDLNRDFKIIERIPQQLQEDGLVYDTIYSRPISIKLDRKEKLQKISDE